MASSSAPKHDFAPAWLKIPANSRSNKPSGASPESDQISSYRDEELSNPNSFGHALPRLRYSGSSPSSSSSSSSYERHSSQRDSNSRENSKLSFPFRHHSIDSKDSQYSGGGAVGTGGSFSDYQHTSGSSIPLRQQFNSPLERRPTSRQEFKGNGFPNYSSYKGNNFDLNSNSRNSGHWNSSRQRSFDSASGRSGGNSSTNSSVGNNGSTNNKKEKEVNDSVRVKDSADKFNQDFPSLQGDNASEDKPVQLVNGGVWVESARRNKVQLGNSSNKKILLVQKTIHNGTPEKRNTSPARMIGTGNGVNPKLSTPVTTAKGATQPQPSSTIYRAFIPSKGNTTPKPNKENLKVNGPTIKETIVHGSRQSSPTPQVKILNTRLITHPKTVSDKKSDFLRTLRDDSVTRTTSSGDDYANDVHYGMDVATENNSMLSAIEAVTTPKTENLNEISDELPSIVDKFTCCLSESASTIEMQLAEKEENEYCGKNSLIFSVDEYYNDQESHINEKEPYLNGITMDSFHRDSAEDRLLSSSLEAEQRLLRSMGWKEDDEDEEVYAPLTEDEVKEFEMVKQQMIQPRNGLQQRLPFTNWSPKRIMVPLSRTLSLVNDGDSSTSDSDSDSD